MPKINSKIWKKMNQGPFKKRDLRCMNVQKAVIKSAYAITKVTEQTVETGKRESKEHMIKGRVQTHYHTTISMQRRTFLKPTLRSDHGLCDSTVPITNWLFGDNLSATLKQIRKASHLRRDYKLQPKNYNRRGGSNAPPKEKRQFFPKKKGNQKNH